MVHVPEGPSNGHAAAEAPFDRIVLVFNPDPAKKPVHTAHALRAELAERLPDVPVQMLPTAFAGHAREVARAAAAHGRPLLVSVSGDGGYNEVVNGVMDSGGRAPCAVVAAGNANDHRRSTSTQPLVEAIVGGRTWRMDLLRLSLDFPEGEAPGGRRTQYAHSYIGFGVTPAMAIGIEEVGKGRLRELIAVARTIPRLRPVELVRADGARAEFDSLILANITGMAKYGTVSESGQPMDGRFEVIAMQHASRWRLALMTLRAVTVGLGPQASVKSYAFTVVDPVPFQIDGEILQIPAGTSVLVESVPGALAIPG
ncbi:hypothetical protein GCM10023081_07910 [Arthrobacter ginkgonis]|uniref:DAGKc domain-containing protein n=1 Tax=Arthrobacter ginkgonis TaxID=1630594 RepID=A0ABP7BY72_9MICC